MQMSIMFCFHCHFCFFFCFFPACLVGYYFNKQCWNNFSSVQSVTWTPVTLIYNTRILVKKKTAISSLRLFNLFLKGLIVKVFFSNLNEVNLKFVKRRQKHEQRRGRNQHTIHEIPALTTRPCGGTFVPKSKEEVKNLNCA